MALREELRDPWTYVLGGIAAGVAWAVGLPAVAFVGVGAGVAAVKAVSNLALGTGKLPPPPAPLMLEETSGTPEAGWLTRAESAAAAFDRLARSIPDQILSERSRSMAEQAAETLSGLRRLAGQASTTRAIADEADVDALKRELGRLTGQRDRENDPDIRIELTRSVTSVQDQIDIAGRLRRTLAQILARIESGALGLERLVAQLGEILAISASGVGEQGAAELGQLADELEGLRSGLAETEQLTRRTLSATGRQDTVTEGSGDGSPDGKG